MLHQAELLDRSDQALSSRATSTSHDDGGDLNNAALAQVIAAAVTSALRATQRATSTSILPPLPCQDPNMTIMDMALCTYPRSSAEMDLGHIQVARTAWGDTVEARHKICDRSCVAIEPKFSPMDFSKLVLHGASEDLGTMVLAQQTMMDMFRP
jgi:hypothetical protein